MKRKYKVLLITALLLSTQLAGGVSAQRSRTISVPLPPPGASLPPPNGTNAPVAPPVNVPQNVKAKYEGGIFGYNKKQTGTLHFDDESSRLVFRDKKEKEYISIPYKAIAAAYADTQSRRPTAASVIGSASIYTLPALLFKKKYRYLTMQFNDPDTRVSGVTSFKMDNKELLANILAAVAYKAELSPRGEAYVRLNKPKDADQDK
ncbi:MAG TPA: hypothetical protein VGO96_03135 [Pyrinomonadaceae bacterium]|jgi:hypothetical protein|nr:hypothetical protein [Pyrinomonadaceae bacterium]